MGSITGAMLPHLRHREDYDYQSAKGTAPIEPLVMNSTSSNPQHCAWECGLPEYLQHDLDAYKEGLQNNSHLLDCLWCELYGSINGAEIDDQAITHEHATYLRDKFLWHKDID